MALGPIAVDRIWAWCDRKQLDTEAAEVIEYVVRYLDVERAEAEAANRALEAQRGPKGAAR